MTSQIDKRKYRLANFGLFILGAFSLVYLLNISNTNQNIGQSSTSDKNKTYFDMMSEKYTIPTVNQGIGIAGLFPLNAKFSNQPMAFVSSYVLHSGESSFMIVEESDQPPQTVRLDSFETLQNYSNPLTLDRASTAC